MGTTPVLLLLSTFLVALGVGLHHLATGRSDRGLLVIAGAFALFDAALVRGFVYQVRDGWTVGALSGLCCLALWELGGTFWLFWKRRRPSWQERRVSLFGQAGGHYAAGRFEAALGPLALARRGDPWDPAARVWEGACRLQLGQPRRARSAFRKARALDRRGEWELALRQGFEQASQARKARGRGARPGPKSREPVSSSDNHAPAPCRVESAS